MPRPIKDPAAALSYRLNVRMTETEGQQLETTAAASGQTVSDFVRGFAVKAKPRRTQATPERQALIRSLGQLGNIRADINQLVKDRQAHHFVSPDRVDAALRAIVAIADRLHHELPGDGD